MTRTKLTKRIAYWQDRMGAGGWTLYVSGIEPEHECRANTDIDLINREAAIRIHPLAPDSQIDRLIVHELGHVLMAEMEDLFDRTVGDHQAEAQALLHGQWKRSQEWVLERLASVITGQERREFNPETPEVWKDATPVR